MNRTVLTKTQCSARLFKFLFHASRVLLPRFTLKLETQFTKTVISLKGGDIL